MYVLMSIRNQVIIYVYPKNQPFQGGFNFKIGTDINYFVHIKGLHNVLYQNDLPFTIS